MKSRNIEHNKRVHDKTSEIYNNMHTEIYNDYEQERIKKILSKIIEYASGNNVLDLGAGTGNLSLKFLDLGYKVVAADVSRNSLEVLKRLSNKNSNLSLQILEDIYLPFEDNCFDIVVTYSVLHHIEDYVNSVEEMIRVTRPGAVIYIDHERNYNAHMPNEHLKAYYDSAKQNRIELFKKLINNNYLYEFIKYKLIKWFINEGYSFEGDVYITEDMSIKWEKIKEKLQAKCKIIEEVDYLMYKPEGGLDLYYQYKEKCNDTKYIIAQKF